MYVFNGDVRQSFTLQMENNMRNYCNANEQ